MRLSLLPLMVCLLGSVAALPVESHDEPKSSFEPVEICIFRYRDSLLNLLPAIYKLDRITQADTIREGHEIEDKMRAVTQTLRSEAQNIRNLRPLTSEDVMKKMRPLTTVMTELQNQVRAAWLTQKKAIVAAGGKQIVSGLLREQWPAYEEYDAAIMLKLPNDMGVGREVAERNKRWLKDVMDAFR